MNIHKMFSVTLTVLGIGYVLTNIAMCILLGYFLFQFSISSLEAIAQMGGRILFIVASIMLVIVGFLLIMGGIQHSKGHASGRVVFLGVLYASLYLLCLGMGSVLLVSETPLSVPMLVASPILIMVGVVAYISPSSNSKLVGSALGIVGGFPLAISIFSLQPLQLVFVGWDLFFPGPFMSTVILEGVAVILGSVAAFVNSLLSEQGEKSVLHLLLSIVGLVYGIGVFTGSMIFAFGLWNLIWKAPWNVSPLYGVPYLVIGTTTLWSVSLIVLAIGGALLVGYSCLELALVTKRISKFQF